LHGKIKAQTQNWQQEATGQVESPTQNQLIKDDYFCRKGSIPCEIEGRKAAIIFRSGTPMREKSFDFLECKIRSVDAFS
jgi:hypothetical protein